MKKLFSILSLATLTIGLLGSCSKINERIDGLDKRVYDLENKKIASIEQQIAAINQSIADLETIRTNIQNLKNEQEAQGQDITALKAADITLEGKINDLKAYVDTELAKYATKDWANATFATLAVQAEIITDVETLKAGLADLDTKLDQDIANLKTYIEGWVNTQLSAYYKKAEIDVKVGELQAQITTLKEDNETNTKIAELESNLATLTQDLEEAKTTIKTEYDAAITVAINENNGTINQTIQSKIDEVNVTITALTGRVDDLETAVDLLTGRIDAIEAMIQTVTIVPVYTDGSVESTKDGVLHLDIIVTPAEAVATLTKDSLKVMVNEVKTKAVVVDTVAVTKFKVDAAKGSIAARADISSVLPEASGKALTIAVNVRNGISDYTTEFYPVTLSTESNVTVTDEGSTTKVTIKADEDFPESSAGNIVVTDGFKDSKPTTVDIEVGGRGTVIFNAKATSQIKANAEQAGATSVFFKVEDVTTTKPVENADVVLEVTMKTVDENGTDVFDEDNTGDGAEVTIEIPIPEEKDVAFVNSVTLVNDAGKPVQGGVVPGSKYFDKEKGILSFKVNHFSKYAIDYVTKTDFVAVTGVSIEPASVTLEAGDTLRLAATIAPENATNKEVSWRSDNTGVATVDATGKVTAVKAGTAAIIVTTKDGGKTNTCSVTVTDPAPSISTIADVLATVDGGFPESTAQNTVPDNAWRSGNNHFAYVYSTALFIKQPVDEDGSKAGWTPILLDNPVTKGDNSYTYKHTIFNLTFKMEDGILTSIAIDGSSITANTKYDGTYTPSPAADYVEIGGVKWATMNLGATTVAGSLATCAGDYYAWGETEPYYGTLTWDGTTGTFSDWKTGKASGYAWLSYCGQSSFTEWSTAPYDGTTKNLTTEHDVVQKKVGDGWRMPTSAEFKALYDACINGSYDKTTYASNACGATTSFAKGIYWCGNYDGVAGCLFCDGTNKVFFPAAGDGYNTSLTYAGSFGYYWSSSLYSDQTDSDSAYRLRFLSNSVNPQSSNGRCSGFPVRPVKAEDAPAPTPTLPDGALAGKFTVNAEGKQVRFSKGNLIATIDASGNPTAWRFAANQYDYLGEGGANKTIGTAAGDVDLFGWSTSNNGGTSTTDNYGIKTSTSSGDYSGEFYDWGKAVDNKNTWRTLTIAEWEYLPDSSEQCNKGVRL